MLDNWAAEALKHASLGQAEAARRMREHGHSMDRAAVNKLVIGKRGLDAAEMLSLSEITGYPIPGHAKTVVPLLSWVSAGKLVDSSSQIEARNAKTIPVADLPAGDYFALRVVGDSMDRLSPEDSVIIVNRGERELVPNKAFVFAIRGEATYKLWRPKPPRLDPFSTNPANEPRFIDDGQDLHVIGRVRRTILDM